jgi:hypothetical protein
MLCSSAALVQTENEDGYLLLLEIFWKLV